MHAGNACCQRAAPHQGLQNGEFNVCERESEREGASERGGMGGSCCVYKSRINVIGMCLYVWAHNASNTRAVI